MGIGIGFSTCRKDTPSSETVNAPLPNPNKFRWEIVRWRLGANKVLVVSIRYLDCTNYEGIKILVYDNVSKFEKLHAAKEIDPHFSEIVYSPIARFEPTDRGFKLACSFADTLQEAT